jgi:ABC-type multidrug transport system ATPase subunit
MLHAMTLYRTRGVFKRWALGSAALTFFFVILATWTTRTGLISSVHAFVRNEVLIAILTTLLVGSGLLSVGLVSHSPMLYLDLTAQENLRFYADMYGLADREERITELLELLELSHRRYDPVRTFSKGMRQRLAIARAILHRPRVLLLDEPHSRLDPRAVDILDGLLAEIRAEDTFVMVMHHIEKGLEFATRLMIVDAGKIVWEHDAGVARDTFKAVYREHLQEGSVL